MPTPQNEPLLPCLICGHTHLYYRTTKVTVSSMVEIRCFLCNFTVEMNDWDSLRTWWNTRPSPPVPINDLIDTLHLHTLPKENDQGDYCLVNRGELEQVIERAEKSPVPESPLPFCIGKTGTSCHLRPASKED